MDQLTTTLTPLVIDLAIAAVILLVAFLKAKRGLYQSVMSVAIVILAIAIGFVGSKLLLEPVTDFVWDQYGPKVEQRFNDEVDAALKGENGLAASFQKSWNRVVKSFNMNKLENLIIEEKGHDFTNSEVVENLRAITLLKSRLLIEKVCHLGLFGVLTAVSLLLLTLLKNLVGNVADWKIIGWVNRLGGFILGFIEVIVIMLLVVRGAGLLNIMTFENLSEGTVLLKWLIGGDVQSTLRDVQNMSLEDIKKLKIDDFTTVDLEDVKKQVKELVNEVDTIGVTDSVKDILEDSGVNGAAEDLSEQLSDKAEGTGDKLKDLKDKVKSVGETVNGVKETVDNVKDAVNGDGQ